MPGVGTEGKPYRPAIVYGAALAALQNIEPPIPATPHENGDLGPARQLVAQQEALGKLSAQDGEAMSSMLEMRLKSIESEQLDSRPAEGETAMDHSLLTDEQ